MCRLLGVFSREPVNASYYVLKAPKSLVTQSHADKKRLQGDGWGIGWFSGGQPRIFKRPQPLYRDLAQVRKAIRQPTGHILAGHVRWASNPLKLSRNELIGTAHTQPFSHGKWLFVHNGTLFIPREVKAELGSWAKFVKGKNDSEVLFYWLLKTVIHGKSSGWTARLRASFRTLDQIWQGCKARYPIYTSPYHGMNWILTDGKVFLAFCYVNSKGFGKTKALCSRRQPYYELQVKQTDRTVIVASEPLDLELGWKALRHGQLLVAQKSGPQIAMKTLQVM